MLYTVLLFIRAPFYVLLVFIAMYSDFLVVLVKLSIFAKWWARKTPPRKPNRDEMIVFRKPRPKSVYNFLGILYFLFFMFYDVSVLSPALRDTPMARYRLFMLKVPLNTNKPTKNLGAVTSCCICLTLYLVTSAKEVEPQAVAVSRHRLSKL